MPEKGTLAKDHIINAVIEQNSVTQKKSFETVEILLELIKQSLESGNRQGHDAETPQGCDISEFGEAGGRR